MSNSETNKAIIAACVLYANSVDSSHDVYDVLKLMRIIAELDNQIEALRCKQLSCDSDNNPCKGIKIPYTDYRVLEPEDHKEYTAKDKDRFVDKKPLVTKVITKYGN